MKITKSGAEALYLGIVGDTARFMYRNTDERTFAVAEALVQEGIDIVEIYNRIYMKKAKDLQINKFILNNHQFDGGVAVSYTHLLGLNPVFTYIGSLLLQENFNFNKFMAMILMVVAMVIANKKR